jgi:hypothetical protein
VYQGRTELYGELTDIDEGMLVGNVQVEAKEFDDALCHKRLACRHLVRRELTVADVGEVEPGTG